MSDVEMECSLKDNTKLRDLILANPGLPLMVFCGEDAWHDNFPYEMADVNSVGIQELTLYHGYWMDKDDYEDHLSENMSDMPEYKELSDEEFDKILEKKIEETKFVRAIVMYIG